MPKILTYVLCAIAVTTSLANVAHAGNRLDNILKTNTLRVGTPGDYRPFAMKEGNDFVGHDIDVAREMAAVYGWKVEFVQTSWKTMADDLKANRFDVAVGGITRSATRVTYADFFLLTPHLVKLL